ncbi:hypothetical protein [Bacteroides faecis]|jgi:hypothetical protein|uniref:hypothetical protein n=1 Tax=Bacteroides faecis TaxID=674529 RepID=UPI001C8C3F3A|nr:hypothetical protein [Bacteroides faecis]
MKKKLQINVIGKESTENIRVYDDLVRCNICINGRTCTFWTTEANYKALIFDGFFVESDSTGAINTTNVFTEEESS